MSIIGASECATDLLLSGDEALQPARRHDRNIARQTRQHMATSKG
jgi:hypothetical protein